jgi:CheY-like chemotaxis protein
VVVEDDSGARELFRTALLEDGFNVTAVEDGFAALQYLETVLVTAARWALKSRTSKYMAT